MVGSNRVHRRSAVGSGTTGPSGRVSLCLEQQDKQGNVTVGGCYVPLVQNELRWREGQLPPPSVQTPWICARTMKVGTLGLKTRCVAQNNRKFAQGYQWPLNETHQGLHSQCNSAKPQVPFVNSSDRRPTHLIKYCLTRPNQTQKNPTRPRPNLIHPV